jgi:hypothetical protein
MTVVDERREPFSWVALAATARVRRDLPADRQPLALRVLWALAEAASLRHDGKHRDGDTLRQIAELAVLSERRARDGARDLEALGLVRIDARADDHGRTLPTNYVLLDGADAASTRSDGGSARDDATSGADANTPIPSAPTRARDLRQEEEAGKASPSPSARADRERVFAEWLSVAGKTGRTVLDAKRRRLIDKALIAYPVDDVLDAVRGWRHSPHHRGENDTGTVYNDLGLLLRDGEHIERFRDFERNPPQPKANGFASSAQAGAWTAEDMLELGRQAA